MSDGSLLDIALEGGWKKYFYVDLFRALCYCKRILGLREKIAKDRLSPLVKKIVMGVIGRNTIGHWRDVQTVFRRFFGIVCINCDGAVKRIALGMQFDNVVDQVSLRALSRGLTDDVQLLASVLNTITSTVGIADGEIEADNIAIDATIKRLAGNPLEVFRIIKGFYSTAVSLLPLYNRYTFFNLIARSVHKRLLNTFFPSLDMAELSSRYKLRFDEVRLCRDAEYLLYTPSNNSVVHYVNLYVGLMYKFMRRSLRLKISAFFNLVDEEEKFVSVMIKEVENIQRTLFPSSTRAILDIVQKASAVRRPKHAYAYSTVDVVFRRNNNAVIIGSNRLKCDAFLDGLSPYILTGLAYLSNLREKADIIEAKLHIYYPIAKDAL